MDQNQDPEAFYLSRLGPNLLSRKLAAYKTSSRATIKAQAEAGNDILAPCGEDFSLEGYLDSIKDVLTLPLNRTLCTARRFVLESCALRSRASARTLHERVDALFIGFYPIDLLTATLIETAPKKFLILVNEGIVHLLFRAGLLAVKAMEQSEKDGQTNPEIVDELVDDLVTCFSAYTEDRPFPSGRSLIVSPSGTFTTDRVVQWSLRFICAHELGHILSPGDRGRSNADEEKTPNTETIETTREEEFRADEFSCRCLSRGVSLFSPSEDSAEEMRLGIALFFYVVSLHEAFSSAGGEPLCNTHPSGSARLSRAMQRLRRTRRFPASKAHVLQRFAEGIFERTNDRLAR